MGDRHTELLGFFLSRFANSKIDLVHRHVSDYSSIGYFERELGLGFHRVLAEYDRRERYDLVVLLTSNEAPLLRVTLRKRVRRALGKIGLEQSARRLWLAGKHRVVPPPEASQSPGGERPPDPDLQRRYRTPLFRNTRQMIAICHVPRYHTAECPNLALSPLLKPLPWLLPVFEDLPVRDADARRPTVCCMGLLEERYYQIIPTLARALPDHEFRLFVRAAHPTCVEALAGLPNVNIAVGVGTDEMMEYLATSRYLLVLDHPEGRYRKDRLSGAIPIGLNLAVPMVMSQQLADLYEIRDGVVTYDDVPDDELAERMSQIDAEAYRALIADTLAERSRLAQLGEERLLAFLDS